MKLYRIVIKPDTSYVSPLQSDTFFGAFCWAYKYLYGEPELEDFLQNCIHDGPQIIFSNAFPSGYLPLPMGIHDNKQTRYQDMDKKSAKKVYQDNKAMKKCTLVSTDIFHDIQQGLREGFSDAVSGEKTIQTVTTHNMVSRENGTVSRIGDSGNLFVTNEFFTEDTFDLYILTALKKETVINVLKLMFELGIGARKSVGKGHFSIVDQNNDGNGLLVEETELLCNDGANGYVALSNFIPAQDDPTIGWYKLVVKYGKLDREYAAGQCPFKKPLLFIQAGALFGTDDIKEYYGRYMTNISAVQGTVVNACTIALPIMIGRNY